MPSFSLQFFKYLLISSILMMGGCLTVKPSTKKGRGKLYESFYVGEEGLQYFVKPLTFESQDGTQLLMDISFRHKADFVDSAIVNFSLFGEKLSKQVESVEVKSGSGIFTLTNAQLLFVEKEKGMIESRFTSKANPDNLSQTFSNGSWQIKVNSPKGEDVFLPINSSRKAIAILSENVFSIL